MATGVHKSMWSELPMKESTTESAPTSSAVLSYCGKASEAEILSTIPATLRQLHSPPSDPPLGRLYYGDNLPILATMMEDPSIAGRIRLIYIDPPFATERVFQSRAQQDAYQDLLSGTAYIEFLRRRLVMLRELLANNGSLYVHLDGHMAFHIKVILDELFGATNFRSWITRKKCNPKNYTRNTYGNVTDYILFYSKSRDYVWHRPMVEWTEETANKEYQYVEKETGRKYKRVPLHAPGVRNGETGKPWMGMQPPPGKHWQYPPAKLTEMDREGRIYWSRNGIPVEKCTWTTVTVCRCRIFG